MNNINFKDYGNSIIGALQANADALGVNQDNIANEIDFTTLTPPFIVLHSAPSFNIGETKPRLSIDSVLIFGVERQDTMEAAKHLLVELGKAIMNTLFSEDCSVIFESISDFNFLDLLNPELNTTSLDKPLAFIKTKAGIA